MTISDQVAARLRTGWPLLLGYCAAQLLLHGAPLVRWLHDAFGVTVTAPQVAAGLGIVLGYGIYEAGRALERVAGDSRPRRLSRLLGRLLLSAGKVTGRPVYAEPGADVRIDGIGRRVR